MTLLELTRLIDRATASLLERDHDLFLERTENAVACRFARYIQDEVDSSENTENHTVDAHYLRHIGGRKRIDNKQIEADIIIHRRRDDEENFLVIEIETNNVPERNDVWKIEEMTKQDGEYRYTWGLYLVFGIGEKAGEILEKNWYKNGRPITL
jgi:hypothetical protein